MFLQKYLDTVLEEVFRYSFQESWYFFFKKKGLCEKSITCSKSKEF